MDTLLKRLVERYPNLPAVQTIAILAMFEAGEERVTYSVQKLYNKVVELKHEADRKSCRECLGSDWAKYENLSEIAGKAITQARKLADDTRVILHYAEPFESFEARVSKEA